jgi:hypothetical protein
MAYNRTVLRAATAISNDSSHSLACRYLPYVQANAGIEMSLLRLTLKRRSTSTSFRTSPMTRTIMPTAM